VSLASRLLQRIHPDALEAEAGDGTRASIAGEAPPSITVVPAAGHSADLLADVRREALEQTRIVGLSELRAAAMMVAEGEARRVTLIGFASWPGLLTEIERLSREFDLTIIPAVVRPGGRVDLIVSPPDSRW
jgi:hypothetical protein